MNKLTDTEFSRITNEWSKLPDDIKDKYKNLYFNVIDRLEGSGTNYEIITSLINKYNAQPSSVGNNNIEYVHYIDGQFRYMDQHYNMNKKQDFITKLINLAKKNGRLTKQQDYFLMYYLKNGDTPYHHKLLPNNY